MPGYCTMSGAFVLSARSMVALLLLFALLLPSLLHVESISLSKSAKQRRKWRDKEVISFVKQTSVGCPVEYVVTRNDPSKPPKGLRVQLINPSRAEEFYFDKLPVTLTLADRNLSYYAARSKSAHESRGDQKALWRAIPMNHPGQDRKMCINMTLAAASGRVISFYEGYRKMQRGFYVMNAVNALVHPSGVVMLSCGYVLDSESCETRNTKFWTRWVDTCRNSLSAKKVSWSSLFSTSSTHEPSALLDQCLDASTTLALGNKAPLQRYPKVFVVPAMWDFNYHHFLSDSLGRMAHSIPFLRKHPDVFIHIREAEDYDATWTNRALEREQAKKMRSDIIHMLGIAPSRLISGPVLADILFLPRAIRCSYTLSHMHAFHALGRELVMAAYSRLVEERKSDEEGEGEEEFHDQPVESSNRALIPDLTTLQSERAALKDIWIDPLQRASQLAKKFLIVQPRYHSESHWSNFTTKAVQDVFAKHFPSHHVVVFDSVSPRQIAEQFYLYSKADVLVGLHGTGLTNMLAMPPNSLIVEFIDTFDRVTMPVCGYYGSLSATMGHHHFLKSYNWQGGEIPGLEEVGRRAREFYDRTRPTKTKVTAPQVYKVSPRLYP